MTPMIMRTVFLTLVVNSVVLPIPLPEVIADSAQLVGQATPQQGTSRSLGQFDLGALSGSVELLERDSDVLVYVLANTDVVVGNRVTAGGKPVPSDEIQVWMLLEQGNTAPLRQRVPSGGN